MKISIQDVQAGRFFVKSYMVREIIEDFGRDVKYRSYLLESGEPAKTFSSECSKRHITRWAEREAAPEEIDRMQISDAHKQEEIAAQTLFHNIMSQIPGELLLEEIRHRGLTLE